VNRDAGNPWLRPLWRRIAVVAVCAIWTLLEVWSGDGLWTTIAGAMTAYGAWIYLINWQDPKEKADAQAADPADRQDG
jgi:hypothetical protein